MNRRIGGLIAAIVLALVGLLLATFATMLGNLLADLAYAWDDPRVSLGEEDA